MFLMRFYIKTFKLFYNLDNNDYSKTININIYISKNYT